MGFSVIFSKFPPHPGAPGRQVGVVFLCFCSGGGSQFVLLGGLVWRAGEGRVWVRCENWEEGSQGSLDQRHTRTHTLCASVWVGTAGSAPGGVGVHVAGGPHEDETEGAEGGEAPDHPMAPSLRSAPPSRVGGGGTFGRSVQTPPFQ